MRNDIKKLHRVYFGFDGKPDMFGTYLETWKRELPDFEIVHWNSSNLPMDANDYVRQLYAERDHAFLTDYFRWWILREYGGVYLDADVEIVSGEKFGTLVDELAVATSFDSFIGIDEKASGWYTAHSMASRPNSALSTYMCEVYEGLGHLKVWRKKALYLWAPQITASYFANHSHHVDGMGTTPRLEKPTVVAGVKIYPQEYFSPLSPTGRTDKPFVLNGYSEDTSLCHHFACTWHSADSAYASHSKANGGAAGVLLRELIKAGAPRDTMLDRVRRATPQNVKTALRQFLSI